MIVMMKRGKKWWVSPLLCSVVILSVLFDVQINWTAIYDWIIDHNGTKMDLTYMEVN